MHKNFVKMCNSTSRNVCFKGLYHELMAFVGIDWLFVYYQFGVLLEFSECLFVMELDYVVWYSWIIC